MSNPSPTVLVVEDDPDALESVGGWLSQAGYRVSRAKCGAEALQLAILHHPAAIFLDVRLPDVDGVDLAERLRDVDYLATTPILFLTGRVDSHVLLAARWLRNTFLLCKPCDRETVLRCLESALNGSVGGGAANWPVMVDGATCCSAESPFNQQIHESPIESGYGSAATESADSQTLSFDPRMLCELVDDVTHDARSTIFVVSEYAGQTAAGLVGPDYVEQRRMLRTIEDRMVEMRVLTDMLDLGRRTQQCLSGFEQDRSMLREFVHSISDDCQSLCRRKSCRLAIDLDDADPLLDANVHYARVAATSAFAHALSLAESSSPIRINTSQVVRRDVSLAQVSIHVQTLAESPEYATSFTDQSCAESCHGNAFPKLAAAAAILRCIGGTVQTKWIEHQYSILLQLPIQEEVCASIPSEMSSYAAMYPCD